MNGKTYIRKVNTIEFDFEKMVRGVGLEPTKACAIGASVLLLRPSSDIPALLARI